MQIAVAGPLIRGMAWLIDSVIRLTILLTVYFVLLSSSSSLQDGYSLFGIFLIFQFLISWFYTTAFEAITGSTPGKKIYGLCVVHDNATTITWSGSLIRNFLRVVDNLPFLYMVGLSTMLIDNRFRRLGDLAAGTLVIYKNKPTLSTSFSYTTSLPPPEWLTRDNRQAIVDFAERCDSLSPDRQSELAGVLAHLLNDDDDAVHTLKSWAQWILRGQANAQPASV